MIKKLGTLLALAFCLNGRGQCTPPPPPAVTASSSNVCAGGTVTFAIGAPVTGMTYSWSESDGNSGTGTTYTVSNIPSSPNPYLISVTSNSMGCTSPAGVISVTVNAVPYITLGAQNNPRWITGSYCPDSLFAPFSPLTSYSWMPTNEVVVNTTYPYQAAPTCTSTTTYTVTGSNGSCAASATLTLYVISPTFSFSIVQDAAPHTWDLYPSYPANVLSVSWNWDDGSYDNTLYPSHTYSVAGRYNICGIVTYTNYCSQSFCLNDSLFRLANNSPLSNMVYVNVLNSTTGIEQFANNNEINIYPNPNNGSFVIEPQNTLYNVRCTMYDVNGKAVLTQTINGKTIIDAGSLNEGIYNISLQSNEGVVNKRVVIVR